MRKYLVELRKNQRFTQQDMAERLQMSRQYYTMIEVGRRSPNMTIEMAQNLSKVLKVSFMEIVKKEKSYKEDL